MHPIILKPQKCISNQSIWIAEFSVGFRRRLFSFSSPIETKPSLFIRCARFLLRKEYGTTLIWSYSFWWIMFIKDMMHFLICVMKHSECIVSIFQMKDKHQCISTIVPFKNSVWTYSNLWINKDWMFHGYGAKENGCFDCSLCMQKKAEKTSSFNPYHALTSTVLSVLTMPNMISTWKHLLQVL
jgi:hypothetical protein